MLCVCVGKCAEKCVCVCAHAVAAGSKHTMMLFCHHLFWCAAQKSLT